MFEISLLVLMVALIADWLFGDPDYIWSRIAHPVVLFGKAIGWVDTEFNLEKYSDDQRFRNGAFGICILIIGAVIVGQFISQFLLAFGFFGLMVEGVIVFVFLAQRSLYNHVLAVSDGLRNSGLRGGRKAVAMIVGRDANLLDQKGVIRASIETLAENFSDGVVAPAFWYGVFGLPGLFAYKMINTADSMIAYKSDRHLHFGKVTAHIDDLANWLPARVSVIFIAFAVFCISGIKRAKSSILIAIRDAKLTDSPNAGWPESAMAAALNISLGGPRTYEHGVVEQSYLNDNGEKNLITEHIDEALDVFKIASFGLMGAVFLLAIVL